MRTLVIFIVLGMSALAQDAPPGNSPTAAPVPEPWEPKRQQPLDSHQVRVDVLMAEVPEAAALKLLPDLRDPKKVGGAQAALLELVGKNEAKLLDWSEVTTHSGVRAVTETIVEQRYPIEFGETDLTSGFIDAGLGRDVEREKALARLRKAGFTVPSTFESRNTGATLEVEPVVSRDGKAVTLSMAPQFVRLEKMEPFAAGYDADGKPATISQPIFSNCKVNTTVTLRDGERRLIYSGKPQNNGGAMTIFIVGVSVIPPGK